VIALVDYGAGNLASVARAFAAIGCSVTTTSSPQTVLAADAVVVPGVGHFGATNGIGSELRHALRARAAVRPLLGICLGLQFLFDGSDESVSHPGLALLRGRCTALPRRDSAKVPHVGWNGVEIVRPSLLLDGVAPMTAFYFTHSYAAPVTDACVGRAIHSVPFAAAVERGRVFGVQFHPEKSGDAGLKVLRNFVDAV
jgi:glutamine amidotransferase